MTDTRAINFVIALIIIALVIGAFYLFLTKETITKSSNAVKGSAGTLQVDRLISEWAFERSEDLHSPERISKSFQKWFSDRDFVVYSVLESKDFVNCKEETPNCREETNTIKCSFAISKKHNDCPRQKYEQTILVPEKNGVKTVKFVGRVTYG